MAYSHHNVNAGDGTYNLNRLNETNPHFSILKDFTINLEDVKVTLVQDCYHLHRAMEYRQGGNAKPCAVRTTLGWMPNGPLPQQGTAKLAMESLVTAEVDLSADRVKRGGAWNRRLLTAAYLVGPKKVRELGREEVGSRFSSESVDGSDAQTR